jgi:hypothetical protein
MADPSLGNIVKVLQEKVFLKQEVYDRTREAFDELKRQLSKISDDLRKPVKNLNRGLVLEFKDTGIHEAEFTLADETLVFVMHTNIFSFDHNHEIWRKKYVQDDVRRAFCGKIFIYNFLSDSFRYNRVNDVGYLIARAFVNREGHYFIEGKKQLSYHYSDFATTELTPENIVKLLEAAILYSLDFDPFTPPLEQVNEISVKEVIEASLQSRIATGKRLGFQFESEVQPVK